MWWGTVQLLLTDRLACPRCGPTFGLILLADHLTERRVHDGVLGCPNCRDSFTIVDGFADLRAPPRGEVARGLAGSPEERADDSDLAFRMIALLAIPRGPGTVALVGGPARHAAPLVEAVEELEVVAVDGDLRGWGDVLGVSRVTSAPGLPFFSRVLRGVVVDGRLGKGLVFEAARVVSPMSRVVVVHAPEDTGRVLEDAGLTVLAEESDTVVAARA